MDGVSIKYSDPNTNAHLAVNESIILLHSACTLTIEPDIYESKEHRIYSLLSGWKFIIIFTDDVATGAIPTSTSQNTNTDKKEVTITCFKWYGEGTENTTPFVVIPPNLKKVFLIKIKTTAFESKLERRKVE